MIPRPGSTVQAFHPARFGVINTARVLSVGRKYARLDFGPLLGGVYRVRFAHIVDEGVS